MTQLKAEIAGVTVRRSTPKSTTPKAAAEGHGSSNCGDRDAFCVLETAAAANTSVTVAPAKTTTGNTPSKDPETIATETATPAANLHNSVGLAAASVMTSGSIPAADTVGEAKAAPGLATPTPASEAAKTSTGMAEPVATQPEARQTHVFASFSSSDHSAGVIPAGDGTKGDEDPRARVTATSEDWIKGDAGLLRSKRNSSCSGVNDDSRDCFNIRGCGASGGFQASGRIGRSFAASRRIDEDRMRHEQEELLLQTGAAWKSSDSAATGLSLQDEHDYNRSGDSLGHGHGAADMVQSLQSMLLTSEQNGIMRLPNYGCFMHQQENLQALLVDIHEDPEGFKEFVETRRKGIGDAGDHLEEAMLTALTSGGKTLSDYTNLAEIGQGRFSVVFYAECKKTRRPCAIKRIQLVNSKAAAKSSSNPTSKGNSGKDANNNNNISSNTSNSNTKNNSSSSIPRHDKLERRGAAPSSPPVAPAPSPQAAASESATAATATFPVPQVTLVSSLLPATAAASSAAAAARTTTGDKAGAHADGDWKMTTKPDSGSDTVQKGAVGDGAGRERVEADGGRSKDAARQTLRLGGWRNTRGEMTYEQCLKEVGLLKNLASPNIVKLHTCFLDQNVLWLVMDWVDGGDLGGVLKRTKMKGGRLSEMTVWGYFTQICDALLHMHGERIIHRDLKPANVLVSRDGTVKLGDLGLGRYLNTRSVLAMSQVGTPLYMSPETLKGQGHDMVSDIWSLGCVLYELAMLTSPFAGEHLTMKALFRRIVRAEYRPLGNSMYSERLSNLVAHLLMPDPAVRPPITMVQPAAHLALQAQRNGVEGLNVDQLAVCADEIYQNQHMPHPALPLGGAGSSNVSARQGNDREREEQPRVQEEWEQEELQWQQEQQRQWQEQHQRQVQQEQQRWEQQQRQQQLWQQNEQQRQQERPERHRRQRHCHQDNQHQRQSPQQQQRQQQQQQRQERPSSLF